MWLMYRSSVVAFLRPEMDRAGLSCACFVECLWTCGLNRRHFDIQRIDAGILRVPDPWANSLRQELRAWLDCVLQNVVILVIFVL